MKTRTPTFDPGGALHRGAPAALLAAALPALLGLGACAQRVPAHAESQEIRLTDEARVSHRPVYSPDGHWIACTSRRGSGAPGNEVLLVPARGGAARTLTPDTLSSVVAVGWTGDAGALLVLEPEKRLIHTVDLDGRIVATVAAEPLTRLLDVSPDGSRFLLTRFQGDNNDLGVAPVAAPRRLEMFPATARMEIGGCFGPGPGQVTAVFGAAFQASACSIAVWSPGTRAFTPLPLPEARNVEPSWSPDGRRLAYVSDQSGTPSLRIYDAETGRTIEVTSGPEEAAQPDWSPDGDWLAFVRRSRVSHIHAGDPETYERRQVTEGPARDIQPEGSRDGQMIAFVRLDAPERPGTRSPAPALCVVPAAGGAVRRLDLKGLRLSADGGLGWSPDGREVAFCADDGADNVDIYRIAEQGGPPVRVTIEPGVEIGPAWSPDGRFIAFTRLAGGQTQVCAVPSNGGVARQVSYLDGINQMPVWAPDSDRIAYLSVRPDGGYEIWLTSLGEPGANRRIRASARPEVAVAWSGDGRQILVSRGEDGAWSLWAMFPDGSGQMKLGEDRLEEGSGKSFFVNWNAEGRRYVDRIHPGRVAVFADGRDVSQIVTLRVAELIRHSLLARKGG